MTNSYCARVKVTAVTCFSCPRVKATPRVNSSCAPVRAMAMTNSTCPNVKAIQNDHSSWSKDLTAMASSSCPTIKAPAMTNPAHPKDEAIKKHTKQFLLSEGQGHCCKQFLLSKGWHHSLSWPLSRKSLPKLSLNPSMALCLLLCCIRFYSLSLSRSLSYAPLSTTPFTAVSSSSFSYCPPGRSPQTEWWAPPASGGAPGSSDCTPWWTPLCLVSGSAAPWRSQTFRSGEPVEDGNTTDDQRGSV